MILFQHNSFVSLPNLDDQKSVNNNQIIYNTFKILYSNKKIPNYLKIIVNTYAFTLFKMRHLSWDM